jgi:uncharacterized membrane protein YphA (DoxX/SURF4 family)
MNPKEENSRFRIPLFPSWMRWPSIICRIALGSIFIVSGLLKALDAQGFLAALPYYQIPDWLVPFGTLVPPLEVVIGVAFIFGIALRRTSLAAFGMLLFFSAMLLLGISGGELDTCGCFGRLLEQSPTSALFRNLILILFTVIVWNYYRHGRLLWQPWKVGMVTALLLILGTLTGYTVHSPQIDSSQARVGQFFPEEGIIAENPPSINGRQLVFIFVADCEHCWDVVANVKALAADTAFTVIGIAASDRHELDQFRKEFEIEFPIYAYNSQTFATAFRTWPALYYLEDGLIIGRVEKEVPSPKTIREKYLAEWQ